jgi:hypothetical protein
MSHTQNKLKKTSWMLRNDRNPKRALRDAAFLCTIASILFATTLSSSVCYAADWRTGRDLENHIRSDVMVFWSGTSLQMTLDTYTRTHRVAVVRDRRVDPNQLIDLNRQSIRLDKVLDELASQGNSQAKRFGSVFYIGPAPTADRLRTVAALKREEAEQFPEDVFDQLQERRPFSWNDFATPREVLNELADEGRFEIVLPERIPHDLWSAGDLPSLTLSDRITLMAAQFHLMYVLSPDGHRIAFVPIPDDIGIVKNFPIRGDGIEQIAEMRRAAPGIEAQISNGRLYVKGLVEEFERIADPTIASEENPGEAINPGVAATVGTPSSGNDSGTPPSLTHLEFTLNVENQALEGVLNALAQNIGLDLQTDWAACERTGIERGRLISFSVRKASVDELLEAALEPVGCDFRRSGRTVQIAPAQ